MIDLHTHILPAIDDGATDAALSEQMLCLLSSQGVQKIVFTPHFYLDNIPLNAFLRERERALSQISISDIQFRLGAEVEFGELKIDYSSFSKLCIEGTRYILLELPFSPKWGEGLFENLRSFILQTGLIPIIAHIERYPAVLRSPSYAGDLLSLGCYLQVNADSVINAKPNGFVDALLKNRQAYALGSDCHNMSGRRPRYREAIERLSAQYGQEYVDFLQSNMQKIWSDEKLPEPNVVYLRKKFHRYY